MIRVIARPQSRKYGMLLISKSEVTSLEIRGVGSIKGTAEIELILDGKTYRKERLKGRVASVWSGDRYSPTAEIHYRPVAVGGGELKLHYHFGTI
jgi:hypothetical protein